jgi:hypothetical protein
MISSMVDQTRRLGCGQNRTPFVADGEGAGAPCLLGRFTIGGVERDLLFHQQCAAP